MVGECNVKVVKTYRNSCWNQVSVNGTVISVKRKQMFSVETHGRVGIEVADGQVSFN